ncbi:MAG: MBL fold metallo-hydrolase [Clostridiales Family XIII bacterium]|jgi:glyoxylase-like metal-dependent hydrolase (beta-lactamase superfamily II)|nr:MBL fold metallo-hydrolase [Clostridiales Family XIII bacterium]
MGIGAYETIQIDANAWRIEDDVVRMFLFTGTERALLVDTGFGNGDPRSAVKQLTDLPIVLVNTHADEDHVGGNAAFETAFMHPAEYAHYAEKNVAGAKPAPLWEGDVVDLGGGIAFEAILVPGHTPGSICLLDRARRILVAGDTVSKTAVFLFGNARNVPAYIESLKKLSRMRDAFDTIYPSHGRFPLKPDIIEDLRTGAEKLIGGELRAREPPFEIPAKLFVSGRVAFFY